MIWILYNWCWWQYGICKPQKKHYSTTAVTARSIWNELDLDEKDWPTTTEVTAKTVNRNNEWWFEDDTTEVTAKSVNRNNEGWFEDDKTDAGDNMEYAKHQKTLFYHCCNRMIHMERTRLRRERLTHYNRSYSQISELEYRRMIWRWYNWCWWQYGICKTYKNTILPLL